MAGSRETASERVVQYVANTTDTNALQLPPLYDAIEPDALDALIEGMADGKILFPYAGHEVTVKSDGTISLDEQSISHVTAEKALSDDC